MKKVLVFIVITMLFVSFVGCNTKNTTPSKKQQSDDSKPTTSQKPTEPTESQPFRIDLSGQTEAETSLSLTEVSGIFLPLLDNSVRVYEMICNDPSFPTDDATPIVIEKHQYYPVPEDEFKTVEDVWTFAYSAFTKEAAQRLFAENLNQSNTTPRYLELNGELYFHIAAHGRSIEYIADSLEIIKQYDKMIVVSIDLYCYDELTEDATYVMCKTQDGWRMANSEWEAQTDIKEQFIN